MLGGRYAIDANWNTARRGDFWANLLTGKNATVAGLGTLAQLQFDHLDLRVGSIVCKADWVEITLLGPTTEIAAANFPNEIAAILAVVGTYPAFAGVVGKISQPGALVKRSNSIGAQGTEAHR